MVELKNYAQQIGLQLCTYITKMYSEINALIKWLPGPIIKVNLLFIRIYFTLRWTPFPGVNWLRADRSDP